MKYRFLFKARFLAMAYAQASLASALGLAKTFAFAHLFSPRHSPSKLGLCSFGLAKTFIFLLCFLSVCFVQAQDISVVNFQKLENDLDARVNAPVLDQNGKKCALLKVVTLEKGFTFDVGQLGVVTTLYKPAEVWVYVPQGVNKIKIAHPQLGQIKSDDGYYWFSRGVEEATCYRMEITTARVITTVEEPEKRSGYLILTSEPSGASVYITVKGEERYCGKTPMEGEFLAYGTYRYRLAKHMYHQASGEIRVEKGRVEQNIALRSAFGYLQVKTKPEGAQVIIDGQNEEYTSPCKPQLASGAYKVRLIKRLYGIYEKEVTIRDDQTTIVDVTLDPKFAHLVVNSLPEASVYVDGKFMGKGPRYEVDLLEGPHDIEVRLASHKTVKKQIEISAKKNQEIALEPIPILGALDIKSGSTNEATIFIDNKNYGKAPQVIYELLVGKHTVKLEKVGYESIVKDVVIEEGKTFSFEEKMENKRIPLTVMPSDSVLFTAKGGRKILDVLSQDSWELEEQAKDLYSWLTIKRRGGRMCIDAQKNNTQNTRYASFYISTKTDIQTISIAQQADIKIVKPKRYASLVQNYFDYNLFFSVDWLKIGIGAGWPLWSTRAEAFSMRISLFELRPCVFNLGQTYGADFDFSWNPSAGVILPINNIWAGAMRGGFSWSTTWNLGGYAELAAIVKFHDYFSSDIFARVKVYQGRWCFGIGATINLTRGRDRGRLRVTLEDILESIWN